MGKSKQRKNTLSIDNLQIRDHAVYKEIMSNPIIRSYFPFIRPIKLMSCGNDENGTINNAASHAYEIDDDLDVLLSRIEHRKPLKEDNGEKYKQSMYQKEFDSRLHEDETLRKAEAGNVLYQYSLAALYEYSRDKSEDTLSKAIEWYMKAAVGNHITAQSCLGDLYYMEERLPLDMEKALFWYTLAATQGEAHAQYTLGEIFLFGEDLPYDDEKALKWYTMAAENRLDKDYQRQASERLVMMYTEGIGVEKEAALSLKWQEKISEYSFSELKKVADTYYYGRGVAKNPYKYIPLYKALARYDVHEPKYKLAHIYYEGDGVKKDELLALAWYDQGLREKMKRVKDHLFTIYEGEPSTDNIPFTSVQEMVTTYEQLAQAGGGAAQYRLADLYYEGFGVEKDKEKGLYWLKEAAHSGDINAQYELADRYHHGQGIEEDMKTAVYWYQQAAESGDAQAQFQLGELYYKGDGTVVPIDYEKAYKWYSKAAYHMEVAEFRLNDIYDHTDYRRPAPTEEERKEAEEHIRKILEDWEDKD